MNVLIFLFMFNIIFENSIGAIGVAMVEIDAETIIEMEAVLGLIGMIITVGIDHIHTEGFNSEHFMYYELWAEGLIISVGWFLKLEAKR